MCWNVLECISCMVYSLIHVLECAGMYKLYGEQPYTCFLSDTFWLNLVIIEMLMPSSGHCEHGARIEK